MQVIQEIWVRSLGREDALCFHVKLIPGSLLGPGGKQNISPMDKLDIPIPGSPQCRGVLPVAGIKL